MKNRRELLKALSVAGVAGAVETWKKPAVESVTLPVHAMISIPCIVTITDSGGPNFNTVYNVEIPPDVYNGIVDPNMGPSSSGLDWAGSQLFYYGNAPDYERYLIFFAPNTFGDGEVTNVGEGCPDIFTPFVPG